MIEGAVWLHRKLLDSAVWTCSDATKCGFITCLLLANYKDQQWYSKAEHNQIVIARGSFFTTWDKFSALSRLSEQQTRNCFKILSDLNIITTRATRRGTFITILNYDEYQKLPTYRATSRATDNQRNSNVKPTQLEEGKEREERKEGEVPLSVFVEKWQRREDKASYTAEIAMGLKAYRLSFRVEEDIYNKIMGVSDGAIRSKSISEQVAERRRKEGLKEPRDMATGPEGLSGPPSAGEILARVRGLPKV